MEDLTKTPITPVTPLTSEESLYLKKLFSHLKEQPSVQNDSTQKDTIISSPCTRCNKHPASCHFYTTRACVYRSICDKCIKEINAMPRRSLKKKWCSDTIIQAMMQ